MATKRSYGHRIGTGIETVQVFVTAENVNDVVRAGAGCGAVDLLSIDIDGMDYWVWKALDCIAPRVVVIEVQDLLGPERSVVVPYSPSFAARSHPENAELLNYAGASLTAMVKLGHEKGYRFVGTSRIGYNAFFIRGDVAPDWLREPSPAECLMHPWNRYGEQVRWPLVSHLRGRRFRPPQRQATAGRRSRAARSHRVRSSASAARPSLAGTTSTRARHHGPTRRTSTRANSRQPDFIRARRFAPLSTGTLPTMRSARPDSRSASKISV